RCARQCRADGAQRGGGAAHGCGDLSRLIHSAVEPDCGRLLRFLELTHADLGPCRSARMPTGRQTRIEVVVQVTGAGLNSTSALASFQCSAQVLRPLATSSMRWKSCQPT